MAAPDPPTPKRVQRSIHVDREAWKKLRQHAIGEDVDASEIVDTLIREYVDWPGALQAATLRKVRAQRDDTAETT